MRRLATPCLQLRQPRRQQCQRSRPPPSSATLAPVRVLDDLLGETLKSRRETASKLASPRRSFCFPKVRAMIRRARTTPKLHREPTLRAPVKAARASPIRRPPRATPASRRRTDRESSPRSARPTRRRKHMKVQSPLRAVAPSKSLRSAASRKSPRPSSPYSSAARSRAHQQMAGKKYPLAAPRRQAPVVRMRPPFRSNRARRR